MTKAEQSRWDALMKMMAMMNFDMSIRSFDKDNFQISITKKVKK